MIPRYIIKRFCHSHTQTFIPNHKSKCYENIHKLNQLREELNEIKNILYSYNEPFKILYISNIMFGLINMLFYISK
jgi:hypothetical protein